MQQHTQSIVLTVVHAVFSECDYHAMNNIIPTHKAEPLDTKHQFYCEVTQLLRKVVQYFVYFVAYFPNSLALLILLCMQC